MSETCTLQHRTDPERPRRALAGLHVCAACADRVAQALADLPSLWQDLEHVLAGTWRDRVSDDRWPLAIAENPLPLQPAVADHRTRIQQLLASWAVMAAQERGEQPPAPNVHETARWLTWRLREQTRHWQWEDHEQTIGHTTTVEPILAQPWVQDFATEVTDLRGRARALLDPAGIRRVPCGPCREHVEGPALSAYTWPLPCPGTLIARVGSDPEDRTDPTCDNCREVVTVDHHAALRRGLADLVDAQAASAHLDVPVGTIGYWASSGQLERRGKDARGRTVYRLEDIQRLNTARRQRIAS